MINRLYRLTILALLFLSVLISAQTLQIVSITPDPNQNNVSRDSDITMEFSNSINGATLTDSSVMVRGSQSGKLSGVYSGGGSTIVTFNPDNDFRPGETVSVTITTALMSDGGLTLARGYSYSFTVASGFPPATPITFAQRNISGASSQGRDLKILDYDSDGDLDVLTSNEGVPEQIYVLYNDGAMGFCAFNTGGNFRNVEVYDIDGDGDYDNFGATGAFDTELNWFENEGSFPLTEHIISSEDPWTIAGGDMDSDGDIDVLAAVILPNRLLWFANDGAGHFSSAMQIPTTLGGSSESDSYFYIRDINSDGAMDILGFHRSDYNLVWYQNDGNQNFTEHLIANTPDRLRMTTADMDDDGDVDIVSTATGNNPTSAVSWWENDGSENFTEHPIPVTSTGRPYNLSVADIDGDRDIDILAGGFWFENDGSENFSEHIISEGLGGGVNYYSNGIGSADMDNDGDMDIVTYGLYTTSWQENTRLMNITSATPANAEFSAPRDGNITVTFDQVVDMNTVDGTNFRVFSQTQGLIAGALSGGGITITLDPTSDFAPGDIIEVSIGDNILSTSGHRLPATYGFSFQVETVEVDQPGFTPHSITTLTNNATGMDVADIDGDGDMDLVSCSWFELFWHENDGSGNFTTVPITISDTPVGVLAFDQNGDGYTDIWVDNDGSASSTLYTNDGNQNFTESTIVGNLRLKQVSDINNDGDIDIVYLTRIDTWLRWLDTWCDGYGSLGYLANVANRDVQAADMDNDGDTDFIAATSVGPIFYENDGYFNYANQSIDANNTNNVYLSDLDGDGDLDPLFTESSSAVIWYENRLTEDSLDFGDRQEIAPLNMDPRDVVAVDIDGDGDPDVAAVSRSDDKVVWYENRLNEASGDFGPEQGGASIADGPIKILSADLDGDGAMDLITLSENDDELIWFENTGSTMAIEQDQAVVPLVFSLHQNYPNPFNPSTTIEYTLANSAPVRLIVYNIAGQEVRQLVNSSQVAGVLRASWDGKDEYGNVAASGVYMYRLVADDFVQTRKMLLLR